MPRYIPIEHIKGIVVGLSGAVKSRNGGKSIVQQYAEDDAGATSLISLQNNTVKLYTDYRNTENKHLSAVEDMLSAAKNAENALLRAITCPTGILMLPANEARELLDTEVTPVITDMAPKQVAIKGRIDLLTELISQIALAKNSKEINGIIYEPDGVTLRYQPSDQEAAFLDQQKRDDVVNRMNEIYKRAEAGAGSCSV